MFISYKFLIYINIFSIYFLFILYSIIILELNSFLFNMILAIIFFFNLLLIFIFLKKSSSLLDNFIYLYHIIQILIIKNLI